MSREISDYRFNLSGIEQRPDRFSVQVAVSQLKHAQQMVKGIIGTKDDTSEAIDPSKWTAGEIDSVLRLIEEQRKFAGDVWHPGVIRSSHPSRRLKQSVKSRLEKNRNDTSEVFGELDDAYSETIGLLNKLRDRADVAQNQTPTTIPDFGDKSEVEEAKPNNIIRPSFGKDDSGVSVKIAAQIALLPVLIFGGFDKARSVDMSQHQDANHTTQIQNENVTISALNKALARVLYGETINSAHTSSTALGSLEVQYVSTNPNFRSVPGENSQGGGELGVKPEVDVTSLVPISSALVDRVDQPPLNTRKEARVTGDAVGVTNLEIIGVEIGETVSVGNNTSSMWLKVKLPSGATRFISMAVFVFSGQPAHVQEQILSVTLHQQLTELSKKQPTENTGGAYFGSGPFAEVFNQWAQAQVQQRLQAMNLDPNTGHSLVANLDENGNPQVGVLVTRQGEGGARELILPTDSQGQIVSLFSGTEIVSGSEKIVIPSFMNLQLVNGRIGFDINGTLVGFVESGTRANNLLDLITFSSGLSESQIEAVRRAIENNDASLLPFRGSVDFELSNVESVLESINLPSGAFRNVVPGDRESERHDQLPAHVTFFDGSSAVRIPVTNPKFTANLDTGEVYMRIDGFDGVIKWNDLTGWAVKALNIGGVELYIDTSFPVNTRFRSGQPEHNTIGLITGNRSLLVNPTYLADQDYTKALIDRFGTAETNPLLTPEYLGREVTSEDIFRAQVITLGAYIHYAKEPTNEELITFAQLYNSQSSLIVSIPGLGEWDVKKGIDVSFSDAPQLDNYDRNIAGLYGTKPGSLSRDGRLVLAQTNANIGTWAVLTVIPGAFYSLMESLQEYNESYNEFNLLYRTATPLDENGHVILSLHLVRQEARAGGRIIIEGR